MIDISVYAFNERILAVMWMMWGLWLLVPDLMATVWRNRDVLAVVALGTGTALLIAQLPYVRKRTDSVKWGKWPASVRLRQGLHIALTAFAWLMALSVAYADITQVRIVMYVAIGLIHFGKVVRLARYNQ